MDCAVGHVVSHDSSALTVVHDEVKGKVLNKEDAVVAEGSSEEGVKHRVTRAVSHCTAPIGLATSTEVSGLTSKSSLIDLSILGSAERHAVGLELQDCLGSLPSHIVNGVLITEPIAAFHGIVEVPAPIILVHVTQGSVDTSL